MVKNEMSIIIKRPIKEVFAFVSDLQNGPQWQPGLLEARRITKGPLGIGAKFTGVRKLMGRKMGSIVEFTAYEPNRKVAFKSTPGSMPMEASYLFERTAEGTRLTSMIELHPGGFMALAEPMIAASLRRETETHFGNLKDLLESRVTVASS